MSSELIEDLQSRLAFQEDTLTELNRIVANQDRQIAGLLTAVKSLAEKLDGMVYEREHQGSANEVPPHY